MQERNIAVFDFDGTLTHKDTLVLFIHYAFGVRRMLLGFLLFSPLIVLMKLHLYDNSRCKERLLGWFFRRMPYSDFENLGRRFAVDKGDNLLRRDTLSALQRHVAHGDDVYVVSASVEEWVRPVCERFGVKAVLGTRLEVSDGALTGRFATPNCYGAEKVHRLCVVEPRRDTYRLVAYGDSRGDREMFAFADEPHKV